VASSAYAPGMVDDFAIVELLGVWDSCEELEWVDVVSGGPCRGQGLVDLSLLEGLLAGPFSCRGKASDRGRRPESVA